MAGKKSIAVVGVTGSQGGGLVRSILADKSGAFAVRAITRDASSDKGRALRAAGADVVLGDIDDLGSFTKAFTGAYGGGDPALHLVNAGRHAGSGSRCPTIGCRR